MIKPQDDASKKIDLEINIATKIISNIEEPRHTDGTKLENVEGYNT